MFLFSFSLSLFCFFGWLFGCHSIYGSQTSALICEMQCCQIHLSSAPSVDALISIDWFFPNKPLHFRIRVPDRINMLSSTFFYSKNLSIKFFSSVFRQHYSKRKCWTWTWSWILLLWPRYVLSHVCILWQQFGWEEREKKVQISDFIWISFSLWSRLIPHNTCHRSIDAFKVVALMNKVLFSRFFFVFSSRVITRRLQSFGFKHKLIWWYKLDLWTYLYHFVWFEPIACREFELEGDEHEVLTLPQEAMKLSWSKYCIFRNTQFKQIHIEQKTQTCSMFITANDEKNEKVYRIGSDICVKTHSNASITVELCDFCMNEKKN